MRASVLSAAYSAAERMAAEGQNPRSSGAASRSRAGRPVAAAAAGGLSTTLEDSDEAGADEDGSWRGDVRSLSRALFARSPESKRSPTPARRSDHSPERQGPLDSAYGAVGRSVDDFFEPLPAEADPSERGMHGASEAARRPAVATAGGSGSGSGSGGLSRPEPSAQGEPGAEFALSTGGLEAEAFTARVLSVMASVRPVRTPGDAVSGSATAARTMSTVAAPRALATGRTTASRGRPSPSVEAATVLPAGDANRWGRASAHTANRPSAVSSDWAAPPSPEQEGPSAPVRGRAVRWGATVRRALFSPASDARSAPQPSGVA
ncbi:hypothetical protein FNF27_07492 [Cafeteria roenbergensis]|uniref:Uncharacterized protein n=1 Tax=Cafeteria roenbergensis TaxID=33653 RepID=A0A5A8DRF2_CAFRO|nr:hypothetical protein FNF27_07492 [Cafeteria roenbergensis]